MERYNRRFLETFYEVVACLYFRTDSKVVQDIEENNGRAAMYDFAIQLTVEFEEANKDRDWDGDWYDELDLFLEKKL